MAQTRVTFQLTLSEEEAFAVSNLISSFSDKDLRENESLTASDIAYLWVIDEEVRKAVTVS